MFDYDKVNVARIVDYIQKNKSCKTNTPLTIPFRGQNETFDVYRLPINLLRFNKENGRLVAQVEQWEKEHKQPLQAETVEGRKAVSAMLLALDKEKTDILQNDLINYKQREACIIRADGVAVNGNRRMAILSRLAEKGKGEQFSYLNVAILPNTVTENELFTLEAKLQFATDMRSDYTPVNVLLMIERGLKSNSEDAMANDILMLPGGIKELSTKMETLEFIKQYLGDTGHPGEYYRVNKTYAHFVEVVQITKQLKRRKTDDEVEKYIEVVFKLIKCGVGHKELRDIRDISKVDRSEKILFEKTKNIVDLKKEDGDIPLKESKNLVQAVEDAKDVSKNFKDGRKAEVLCKRAYSAISELSTDTCEVSFERIVKDLTALEELVNLKKTEFSKK